MMQPEDKPTRAFSSGIMQSCLRGISLIHFAAEVSIFTRTADRITQLRPQINHGVGFTDDVTKTVVDDVVDHVAVGSHQVANRAEMVRD